MSDPRSWRPIESVHDVVYFAPGADAAYAAVGVRGWWNGYVASRSAALGTAGPGVVTALFHGFAPAMVRKYLPAVWETTTPTAVLDARVGLAVDCLRPLVPDVVAPAVVDGLERIVDGLDLAGRALAAAHAEVPAVEDPWGRAWQLITTLREYRGDSHVAVLVAEGLDGASANLLAEACGLTDGRQQVVRGWNDEEWAAAREQLRSRGWLGADGLATAAAREARERIEAQTESVAVSGLRDAALLDEIAAGLAPLARAVRDSGAVPYPNPTATPAPE